ncbi:phosphopantetheine-binding protein [Motiliproteus sediminis]|uniref:phosphopantetheine-binding protein n=1 Tax=Motiliproteus sediminis TaxID=1468178 RepID=UPI001AEFE3D2|nr:phosphopantetheine-binding protein [Motiliproteus sediminis]
MDSEIIVRNLLQAATARDDIAEMPLSAPLLGHVAELDSMAIVTFFTVLEEDYGVAIDDDEVSAELFESLQTLTDFVAAKVGC